VELLGVSVARRAARTLNRLIENGCTWKEEVTVLSYIGIIGKYDKDKYREKVETLKAQGIELHLV
jgi:hypothetical protein